VIETIVKATARVTAGAKDATDLTGPGTFEVVLSTPTADREGEEVKTEEWDDLPDWINFDVDHGMSVVSTVGSGRPFLDESGALRVEGAYASTDLAQTVRTLVREGHVRQTSVAFIRRTYTGEQGEVVRRELLNGAFVAVPANPEADIMSSKSLEATEQASIARKAMWQAVTKAVADSYEERQQAVQRAVSNAYDDWDTWTFSILVATTDSDAVWKLYSEDADRNGTTWRADYELDDAGKAALGEATQVRIREVVTDLPQNASEDPQDSTGAAAVKAAAPAEDSESEARDRARALITLRARSLPVA
jgi:hypothetical protein